MAKGMLISGSNRGTGRAIAEAFAGAGYAVASLNRTPAGAPHLDEVACDLRDTASIPRAFAQAVGSLGSLDVLVCSAAVRQFATIENMTDAQWHGSLSVNLTAAFCLAREAIPHLRRSRGHLILLGSHAGGHAFEGGAAYCSSKAALRALAEVFMLETRRDGVRTTLINAGAINNRQERDGAWKVDPGTVARVILDLVRLDPAALVTEFDIRPLTPPASPAVGIARLQYV